MPHDLEQFADGTASFFSNREVPWHRLGVLTQQALTAKEALHTARLDWTVEKFPVQVVIPEGNALGIPASTSLVERKYATVRKNPESNGVVPLGIVGEQYTPVQNVEAFDFLDTVLDMAEGAHYETAGVIGGGKRVFMTVKVPRDLVIGRGEADDTVQTYMLCTNAHDGTGAFVVAVTPIRVVCTNTLSLALRNKTASVSIRHTSGAKGRVQQARDALGVTFAYMDDFEAEAERLYQTALTNKEFDRIVTTMFPLAKDAAERTRNSVTRARDEVRALYENAPTQANVRNTAWGALNALVEWSDWVRSVQGDGEDGVARATATLMGARQTQFKSKALAVVGR